ncbi:unnamed protein product [Cylicocyclus nassatus]|uniref:Integrase catalytic domain-containing protein n=1 Tax=Cylicocyclus nassatus TaxID=53992 RepID=A0AA36DRH8_CYLNA|nr:unnamed protein product [Cylicocyclus nassatus]
MTTSKERDNFYEVSLDISPIVTPGDFSAAELIVIREHYREVPQQLHGSQLKKLRTRQEGDGTEVAEDSLVDGFVESQNINWSFITPYSPWKGGFYERLVGSVKSCLKKTVRRETLDLWLFETLILEIEAVLNTRPLFPANSADLNTDLVIRPIDLINPQFRLGRLTYSMPQKIETSSRDHYESLQTQDDSYRSILITSGIYRTVNILPRSQDDKRRAPRNTLVAMDRRASEI